jgi:hypothetical protein
MRQLSRIIIIGILALIGMVTTACDDDYASARPAAFTSPVDGRQYCAWVNNPHECDGAGLAPAPFAMPMTQPAYNDPDHALLMGLFTYHLMYHSFYDEPYYYDHYIGPAWHRYPGTYYAGRGRPVTVINNSRTYTTTVNNFNSKYSSQESTLSSKAMYRNLTTGKTYTGNQVPQRIFKGGNTPVEPAGNAPSVRSPNTGKSGYSGPSSRGGGRR